MPHLPRPSTPAPNRATVPEIGAKVPRPTMSKNPPVNPAAVRRSSSSSSSRGSVSAAQKRVPDSPAQSGGTELSTRGTDSTHRPPNLPDKHVKYLLEKNYGQTDERDDLWRFYEPYLRDVGYNIAWEGDTSHSSDHLQPTPDAFSPRPGKSFTHATLGRSGIRWAGPSFWPSLCGAYDKEGRFVVIKLLPTNGEELKIIRGLSTKPRDKRNHTIPILDIIEAHAWTLVVMPSWELTLAGSHPAYRPEDYVEAAFQCLEGLSYMHELGISHGDVHSLNILVNHVAHFRQNKPRDFYRQFKPAYAFIDFGFSKQFPPGAPRLAPSKEAPLTYSEIPEIKCNEFYDPMAADVYALGVALKEQIKTDRRWCQRLWQMAECAADRIASEIPAYLEVLEGMMAPDCRSRLTAHQAFARLASFRC